MGSAPSGSLFPILTPGAIVRHTPAGDPTIEQYYHQAMEDGRLLEACVGDANNWLLEMKMRITKDINTWLSMNQLAVDGQLGHRPRVPKYIADSIQLLHTVSQYQKELAGVATALNQNITLLLTMKNTLTGYVQSTLNALANLLNNICNWNLPKIPSLPVLLASGHFNWNGFQFSPLQGFAKSIGNLPNLNFNFSFSQCNLLSLGANPTTQPSSITTLGGLTINPSGLFTPPLGGTIATGTETPAQMQAITTPPIYGPTFNPNSSMLGAVPDPHTIIDNYQMPPATYQSNIVSIVPALRGDTIEPTDPDYANPNLTVRQAKLRQDLVHYITLEQVVASNYDPFITSAWLFYLQICRTGRGGNWITNFQAAYNQYIVPSLTSLANNPVPWNNVLGSLGDFYEGAWLVGTNYLAGDVVVYNSTFYIALVANTGFEPDTNPATWQTPIPTDIVYQNTPTDIPLIDVLTAAGAGTQAQLNILWKLSYVEASLLGYTRTTLWDGGGDSNYLSGFTGTDLDYEPTAIVTTNTTSEILGSGTAAYPVSVIIPTAIKVIFDEVVAQATLNIANDITYQSPYPKFKYVYDQFAEATLVDRFTQFWRTFNYNLLVLLAQDPYLVSFVVTYEGALDSAIDPLGDPTDYNAVSADAASRNRGWTPGTPLLNIPTAPIVAYVNSTPPTSANNGWLSPTQFDANAFLMRPDVQALPIPTQLAMLRTNISYAGLSLFLQQAITGFNTAITNAQNAIASASQLGFYVSANGQTVTSPVPVVFTTTGANNFDMSGYVTGPSTFTIQNAGNFAGYGEIDWDVTTAGSFTITVTQNGIPISTTTSDLVVGSPEAMQFSFTGNFAIGDVIQVIAQSTSSSQILTTGYFSMIQTSSTPAPAPPSVVVMDDSSQFTADATMIAGTVVQVQPDGGIAPLNLFVSSLDSTLGTNAQIIAPNQILVTVNGQYFVPSDIITFTGTSGITPAVNGPTVAAIVTAVTPTSITATLYGVNSPMSWAPSSAVTSPGTINLMDQSGVVVQYPLSDGVLTAAGAITSSVAAGVTYGGQFGVVGASFVVGGLVYAGMGGVLTQNYAAITASPLTITATATAGGVLTVTATSPVSLVGASVLLYDTAETSTLNGQTFVVTSMVSSGSPPTYTGFKTSSTSTSGVTIPDGLNNSSDTGTANPAVDYIVCVGRAVSGTELIYEPHIPTLVVP
jgi:hypothetical protein